MGSSSESRPLPLVPPPGRETKEPKKEKKAVPRIRSRGAFPRVPVLTVLAALVLAAGYWAATNLFKSPPQAQTVLPGKIEPGRTVTISGSGFEADPAKNTVRFGDQVGAVTAATASQIAVTVPAGLAPAGTADVPVVVETRAGKSKPLTLRVYRPPQVNGVQPDVAMPGDEITITGQNLDGTPLTVSIGGVIAEVKEAEPGTIKTVVPAVPVNEGGTAPVNVQIGAESAQPASLLIGRLPLVMQVTPSQGPAGQMVVIKGRGFDTIPQRNVVSFGTQPALVLSSTATEVTVAAPAPPLGETQAKVGVTVKANSATSSGQTTFVLTRVSAASFVPRFFAAPVPEDAGGTLAFVCTDLGPVLLLGGKDQAGSTAERAVQVASALNALVEQAPSKAPAFELRKDGVPGVGIPGVAPALLTATPDDAAAYDRPWEGLKGRRGSTTRLVAQHWTALLQDYFGLFVLRQRPLKVLGLSPRGRVLTDVYAEALRTAGAGNGVPTRVVIPPSSTLAKGLRELALLLPAEGAPRAGAALEGLWEGTMAEGATTRGIKVRLRYDGSRLAGTLSARSGGVEMNTPLKNVSFDKGDLRFSVDISGAAHLFRGTVEGEAITGSIQKGDQSASGSFTIKFVE